MLVGGDFYDCIPLDEKRIMFAIGDVSGKGIPAALCMGRIMGDIRSLTSLHQKPSKILAVLNNAFLRRSTRGMFISLLLIVFDGSDMTCTMCNAGHPEPLIVRRDSDKREFIEERGGPIVGIVDDAEYTDRSLPLGPGDMLCLYTDGITEAQNDREEFYGREQMAEQVLAHRSAQCESIIEAVFDGATAFVGQEAIDDDLTMMVLRIKERSET
jgi:sigma-B regulation protein RsbU (phosphoserine phosphatase)